ncbi:MAG: hypothetical protein KGZ88_02100 [Methylomicrobium sp.]|nr:hypothetical protein [Methylomicrobium sp.]
MQSSEKPDKENKFDPPSKEAFSCKQIDLFQTFLCNDDEHRKRMSNTFPLWDCLPLYSISRQSANKMRKEGTFPKLLHRSSMYQGREISIEIQPARIIEEGVVTEYYPGGNEELIEAALRKIATMQHHGYYDESVPSYGVTFSIYQLRKELKNRGHARSYPEIVLSLRIMARSSIEISTENNQTKIYDASNYFRRLSSVSRVDLGEDPDAKWYVEFHPLITKALRATDYRQFNYELMMSHETQLTRWLHKYLVIKFTYAQVGKTFIIRFTTVKRESSLLDNYGRKRDAIEAMTDALSELKANGLLLTINHEKIVGPRQLIEDVIYTLTPTAKFSSEVRAANKRVNNRKCMTER